MGDSKERGKGGGPYGLDPHGEEPPAAPRPARSAREAPNGGEEPSPVKALDICPNCGSPMGPIDTVVCMRCGFDLKTLKVIKTRTAPEAKAPAAQAEPEAEAAAQAVFGPGAGDLWLPGLLGAASLVLLGIGCLSGASGLMGAAEEPAGFLLRLDALLRVVLRSGFLAASGLGGLYVLAQVLQARLGDLKLAAVRMAGIMAMLGLSAFISMGSRGLEWTFESLIQGFGFVGLSMFFFGLKLRDALTLLGVTVFAVLALLLVSMLIQWAAPPV